MRIRLTRKLAERLDGVDVSGCDVGDVLELSDRLARCLILEGWAEPQDAGDGVTLNGAAPSASASPQRRRRKRP